MNTLFEIRDWANNLIKLPAKGKKNTVIVAWTSFEAAEYCLSVFLGDNYDTDRQEYYIEEVQS